MASQSALPQSLRPPIPQHQHAGHQQQPAAQTQQSIRTTPSVASYSNSNPPHPALRPARAGGPLPNCSCTHVSSLGTLACPSVLFLDSDDSTGMNDGSIKRVAKTSPEDRKALQTLQLLLRTLESIHATSPSLPFETVEAILTRRDDQEHFDFLEGGAVNGGAVAPKTARTARWAPVTKTRNASYVQLVRPVEMTEKTSEGLTATSCYMTLFEPPLPPTRNTFKSSTIRNCVRTELVRQASSHPHTVPLEKPATNRSASAAAAGTDAPWTAAKEEPAPPSKTETSASANATSSSNKDVVDLTANEDAKEQTKDGDKLAEQDVEMDDAVMQDGPGVHKVESDSNSKQSAAMKTSTQETAVESSDQTRGKALADAEQASTSAVYVDPDVALVESWLPTLEMLGWKLVTSDAQGIIRRRGIRFILHRSVASGNGLVHGTAGGASAAATRRQDDQGATKRLRRDGLDEVDGFQLLGADQWVCQAELFRMYAVASHAQPNEAQKPILDQQEREVAPGTLFLRLDTFIAPVPSSGTSSSHSGAGAGAKSNGSGEEDVRKTRVVAVGNGSGAATSSSDEEKTAQRLTEVKEWVRREVMQKLEPLITLV